jgi:hypothetical protein
MANPIASKSARADRRAVTHSKEPVSAASGCRLFVVMQTQTSAVLEDRVKPFHFATAKHPLDFCPKNHQMRFSFHLPAAA